MKSLHIAVIGVMLTGGLLSPLVALQADDSGAIGDMSIAAFQRGLNTQSGGGWGPEGPGGTCVPSLSVSCIDAATVQSLGKQLLSAVLGAEISDPVLLADLGRLKGGRSVVKSTYLAFSLYFDDSFVYVFPPPAPGAKTFPLRSLTFPKTLVLEISSNGSEETVSIEKPELAWRETSLRLVPSSPEVLMYVEAVEVNLKTSSIAIEAGLWDVASIWETGHFTNFSLSVDWGRTLLANLQLFFLPLIFLGH